MGALVSAARQPVVGADSDSWGDVLNGYLSKLAGENATELNQTKVNGTNIYSSSINTTHIIDNTITDSDILNTTNITTTGTGFFGVLGSLTSRITQLFAVSGNFNESLNLTGSGIFNITNQDFEIRNTSTSNLFFVNGSTGNVGIGTGAPGSLLHVKGSSPQLIVEGSGSSNIPGQIKVGPGGSTSSMVELYRTTDDITAAAPTDYERLTFGFNQWVVDSEAFIGTEKGGTGSNRALLLMMGSSEIMRLATDGNVGIGTTGPNAKLEVAGDGSGLSFNASDDLFVNDSTGNVGIGTTAPGSKLHVNGTGALLNISNQTNSLFFVNGSTGNVGIGTGAPGAKLEISQDGALDVFMSDYGGTSPDNALRFRTARGTAAAPSAVQSGDILGGFGWRGYGATGFGTNRADITAFAAENWTDSAQGVYFDFRTTPTGGTATAKVMRIDSSGNVGIGTTGPNATLEVINGTTQGGFMVSSSSAGAGDLFIVDENGNVGIGTVGPSQKLHVSDSTTADIFIAEFDKSGSQDAYIQVDAAGDTNDVGIDFANQGSSKWRIFNEGTNDNLQIYSLGLADRVMVMDNNGNIGIGTTGPNAKLEVSGDGSGLSFNASDDLFVNDSTGNVGIGTGVPEANLHVYGTSGKSRIKVEETGAATDATAAIQLVSDDSDMFFGAADDAYTDVTEYTGKAFLQGNGGAFAIVAQDATNGELQFYTGGRASGNRRVTIDKDGNVGIGTTGPNAKLEVSGDGSGLSFNASDDLFVNDSTGNVGIGTATPETSLHIITSGNQGFVNLGTADGNGVRLGPADGAGGVLGVWKGDGTTKTGIKATYIEDFSSTNWRLGAGAELQLTPSFTIGWATSGIGTKDVSLSRISAGVLGVGTGSQGESDGTLIAGNVGIGTTGPNAKLEVSGDGSGLSFNASDDLFVNDSTGNVGIGTAAPGAKLTVMGDIAINIGQGFYTNDYWDTGLSSFAYLSNGYAGNIILNSADGRIRFETAPSGTAGNAATMTERMTILNTGNVGIGTTGPNATLEVINGTTQGGFMVSSSSAGAGDLFIVDENGKVGIGTAGPQTKLHVAGKGSFGDAVTTALADRALNLISTDAVMQVRRHADAGAAAVELKSYRTDGTTLSGYWDFYVGPNSINTGKFVIRDRTSGDNDRLVIDNSGNVGIGTTGPNAKLEVAGDGSGLSFNASDDLFVNDSTGNVGIGTGGPSGKLSISGGDWSGEGTVTSALWMEAQRPSIYFKDSSQTAPAGEFIIHDVNDKLQFYRRTTAATDAWTHIMSLDGSTGNVGIGTTGPNRTLHINDTMRIEPRSAAPSSAGLGDLYVDSDSNELCFYNSTAWVGITSGGTCA